MGVSRKIHLLLIFVLFLSLGGATYVSTEIFSNDLAGYYKRGTLESSHLIASRVREYLGSAILRAQTIGASGFKKFNENGAKTKFIDQILNLDDGLLAISVFSRENGQNNSLWRAMSEKWQKLQLTEKEFDAVETAAFKDQNFDGTPQVFYKTIKGDNKALGIIIPLMKDNSTNLNYGAVAYVNLERLQGIINSNSNFDVYLIGRAGSILASSMADGTVAQQESLNDSNLIVGSDMGVQSETVNAKGQSVLSAVDSVGLAGLRVVAQVQKSDIKLAWQKIQKRMSFVTLTMLFLALMFGVLFSHNIVERLTVLSKATELVRLGNFNVRLRVNVDGKIKNQDKRHGDEIQRLMGFFNEMVAGLQERENLRNIIEKFHNKDIIDRLQQGDIKLGGERVNATVLVLDVRGFTSLSETKDPEVMVELLNKYLSMCVEIIIKNGGMIDKYIGDAVLAVWGVPDAKETDCDMAVKSCLEIRAGLMELNNDLAAQGTEPLKIGMGIHRGSVIAGNIGSQERMQYTVVGDAVNTTFRLEAETKKLGVDLLVSEAVVESIKEKYVLVEVGDWVPRGRTSKVKLFKVRGHFGSHGEAIIIETPYSEFAA